MSDEQIKPNQRFLDGRDVYEQGKTYKVPPDKANYFRAMGWVGEAVTPDQEISLDIQNVTTKTSSKVKGG